jgi:hypothetical protein
MFSNAEWQYKITKNIPEAQQKFGQISVLRRDVNEIRVLILTLFLSTTCFDSNYEPSSG